MTARLPSADPLVGRYLRLERLQPHHLAELYPAIGHAEVFAGGYGGGPAALPADLPAFLEFGERYFRWRDGLPWLVRLADGPRTGQAVGTSTLTDFDLANEHVHLGYTAYSPSVWGTAVNAECKLLLLGLAFDSGFGRVKLQADVRNARSRAAIMRLGATFEGIVRRDMRRADGTWRDSAVYSVLVDEWPRVRDGLVRRLASARPPE